MAGRSLRRRGKNSCEPEDDEISETENEETNTRKKNMSSNEEDILISIILQYFDELEKITTDKSLSPKKLQTNAAQLWTKVQTMHREQSGVSFLNIQWRFLEFRSKIKVKLIFFRLNGPLLH